MFVRGLVEWILYMLVSLLGLISRLRGRDVIGPSVIHLIIHMKLDYTQRKVSVSQTLPKSLDQHSFKSQAFLREPGKMFDTSSGFRIPIGRIQHCRSLEQEPSIA